MLTDDAWEILKVLLKESGRVYNKYEHRNTLEGILYRMRTGIQWRDLPSEFGLWNTVYRCPKLGQALTQNLDMSKTWTGTNSKLGQAFKIKTRNDSIIRGCFLIGP